MNTKNFAAILLIILALIAYYYYENPDVIDPALSFSNQPIYQTGRMNTNIYNLNGELIYEIKSEKTKYFDQSNEMQFERPSVMIYDKNRLASWYMQSKQASLASNQQLYLYHDVQLDSLSDDSQLKQIKTDNAVVNLISQQVRSKDPVEITGTGISSTGDGLFVDLKAKTATLLNNVKTYYRAEK